MTTQHPSVTYLKSLTSVREQAHLLLSHPTLLQSFILHLDRLPAVITQILHLIERDYASPSLIPSHSRWRHFKGIDVLASISSIHTTQKAVAMVDLFVVSVLLDAGAGDPWVYKTKTGEILNRSEGLAVASFDLFTTGVFSSTRTL